MTLHQEACTKIVALPSSAVPQVIAFIESLKVPEETQAPEPGEKMRAYQEMPAMREEHKHKFPKDFDYKQVLEEALMEKYGRPD